ncbi:MAG: efflux RND transporter periplasmic adaptor subunit [Hydrogenovibrio sp.]|uniref:efflux RND transporter periplasmic adaptor subunit n=1 Tax=Hydrogenovibrio sp. TaxID=2065821 RepID=UPI00287074D3|nr:efflux RND transporter periplasmic adaptor subunit [Hydrogenovibrio sp.]MDR9499874.1 efflux RND transporter periplasmic adaptor subunit [Hydrogenovibrio sp.]
MITRINATMLKSALIGLTMALSLNQAWSGQGHAPGTDHEESHAQDDAPTRVFTDHNEHTELFVEFAPLVVGQPSTFITHFTRLDNFEPIEAGQLTIHLQQDGRSLVRFRVTDPARTGIFLPSFQPRDAGRFQLVFELKTDEFTSLHNLGDIEIFAQASQVSVPEHHEGDITYLKEQQWQQDFALTKVSQQALRQSVAGLAQVQAPANGSMAIRAPSDGYFLSNVTLLPGQTFQAQNQLGVVLPKLSEGTDIGHLQVALQQTQTRLALAQAEFNRMQSLFTQGAVPQRRVFEAEKRYELAKVEQQTAQARLNQQSRQKNLNGIALNAPMDGQVIEVNVRSGEFVKTGEVLFTLADNAKRWLSVQIPEKFAGLIRQPDGLWLRDQQNTYRLDPQNQTHLVSQGRMIDPKTRTLALLFAYPTDQAPNVIGARYPARVYIEAAKPRLAIPASAVIDDNGLMVVYVQESGESFSRRIVQFGIRDGDWIEVLDGVKAGERVVSRGAYFVKLASSSQDEIGHGHAH